MRVVFVYGILPAFLSYTSRIPTKFGGLARGPFVKIRPKYMNDIGLHHHEMTHVKQWYRTFGFHGLLYKYNHDYKLKAEVEAYKVQLKHCEQPKYNIYLFADYITKKYGLDVSRDEALQLLSS